MKTFRGLIVLATVLAIAQTASAILLGSNITIWDREGTGSGWTGGPHEDQEVEPGNLTGQQWDLEGFFLRGSQLAMVGGYDFRNGEDGWDSGDIFIDINGDAVYGPAANNTGYNRSVVQNTFGYDYVIDLSFAGTPSYTVYALDADSRTRTVYYDSNEEANPWRYEDGGEEVDGYVDVLLTLSENLPNSEVDGLLGGSHNVLFFDLSFLSAGTTFLAHYTMECGNDNLMGSARVADGGTTLLLLGCALLGVEGIRRKIRI